MNDNPIAGELWFHTGARHYYFIEKIKVKRSDDELWVWWYNLNMDLRDCEDVKWFMQNCKKVS